MKDLLRIKGVASYAMQGSTCAKRKVGAVIFDEDGLVLATGYNGTVKGMPECHELFQVQVYQTYAIHKQVQALIPFEYVSEEGDWFYVTRDEWDRVHRIFAHKYEVHAEQAAIYNMLKTGIIPRKLYLYTTLEPCDQCAKAICAVGFEAVYVEERHKACDILVDKTVYMED